VSNLGHTIGGDENAIKTGTESHHLDNRDKNEGRHAQTDTGEKHHKKKHHKKRRHYSDDYSG
jgi:hypothetical protein